MIHLRSFWALLTITFVGYSASRVTGQAENPPKVTDEMLRESHLTDSLSPPDAYKKQIDFLVGKWKNKKNLEVLELLKNKSRVVKREDALQILKGLSDNPLIPPDLQKLLKEVDREPSPELLEKLQDLVKKNQGLSSTLPGPEEKNGDQNEASAKPAEPENPPPSFFGKMGSGGGGDGAAAPDLAASKKEQDYAQRIMNWINSSPAMRKAFRDLGRHLGQDDPRWQRLSAGMDSVKQRWGQWGNRLELNRFWSRDLAPWLANVLPDMPQLGSPIENPAGRGWPQTEESSDLFSGSQNWELVAGAGGVILAAFVIWLTWNRANSLRRRQQQGWTLGPWPVDPARVLTRGELVQAFEHLSLLRLGPGARNWNHRIIANRLARRKSTVQDTSPDDVTLAQKAVGELASLYEQARYAPPGDMIPEASLMVARRDLCLLAGEAAA